MNRLLDRLLPEQGADGEDVERIEREKWSVESSINNLREAIKKAAGKVPPEEGETMTDKARRWKPEEGETYFYVDSRYGTIYRAVWRNGRMDRARERMRNVFESVEAAYKFTEGVEDDE